MANLAIQRARQAAGLTLEQLSEDVGISVSQLSRFESGKRDPRVPEIHRIATRLGVAPQSLMSEATPRQTQVMGLVGAGAEMNLYAEGQGLDDWVPSPHFATDKTVAVEIRGASLGQTFDGWLIFYDDVRDPPTRDLIGHLCVAGLADGRVLVKQLARGQLRGRFTLTSNTEPPIYDVEISWAAKVKGILPR